jgi:hypothetical protein
MIKCVAVNTRLSFKRSRIEAGLDSDTLSIEPQPRYSHEETRAPLTEDAGLPPRFMTAKANDGTDCSQLGLNCCAMGEQIERRACAAVLATSRCSFGRALRLTILRDERQLKLDRDLHRSCSATFLSWRRL